MRGEFKSSQGLISSADFTITECHNRIFISILHLFHLLNYLFAFFFVANHTERERAASDQIRSLQSSLTASERALADAQAEQAREKRAHGDALEAQRVAMEAKAKSDADKLYDELSFVTNEELFDFNRGCRCFMVWSGNKIMPHKSRFVHFLNQAYEIECLIFNFSTLVPSFELIRSCKRKSPI